MRHPIRGFSEQLEYGLDNANPGYFNGEELIGNEDDSASWYDSSTNETRIRHQLPLLDGSPSLRKKFFFQVRIDLDALTKLVKHLRMSCGNAI